MAVSQQRLETALRQSLSTSGREELLHSGELSCLAGALAAEGLLLWHEDDSRAELQLLPLLRVLRNSCAAGSSAATLLLQKGVPASAVQLAASLAQQPQRHKLQQQLLLVSMQLLCNMAVASVEAAAAVWQQLFPACLQDIANVSQGAVHEALALTAVSCVRASTQALDNITAATPAAYNVWQRLLAPLLASARGSSSGKGKAFADGAAPTGNGNSNGNDNVCLLVFVVAVQLDCLQQLMQAVSPPKPACDSTPSAQPTESNSSSSSPASAAPSAAAGDVSEASISAAVPVLQQLPGYRPCEEHAVLLHILALEVAAQPLDEQSEGRGIAGTGGVEAAAISPWLKYLVQLLATVHPLALAERKARSNDEESNSPSTGIHVLEATLEVLKAILAREDAGRGLLPADSSGRGTAGMPTCLQQLHALGLVQQLLAMMRQLGPPAKPRHQQQQEQQQQQQQQERQQLQEPAGCQPYAGYRTDLVAVLSSMLCEQPAIQGEALAGGGVELLLNNCNLDASAPLAREWALWAIRNMCAGNPEVQQYIAAFSAVEAVQSPELSQLGKELQLDPMTHKLQLVDKQPPPAAAAQ